MSAEIAIWCSRKRIMIPISLCNRSGSDRNLSLSATPWYFAAALHTFLVFCRFMWVYDRMMRFDLLSEHPCQWFLGSASLPFRLSAGVVLGTWVALLLSRSCSVTSLRPLATEVLLHIFHRWIALFAPTSWLLVVPLLNDRWYRSFKRRTQHPTTYSTGLIVYYLQLMLLLWQHFLPVSLVADHLRPSQSWFHCPWFSFVFWSLEFERVMNVVTVLSKNHLNLV